LKILKLKVNIPFSFFFSCNSSNNIICSFSIRHIWVLFFTWAEYCICYNLRCSNTFIFFYSYFTYSLLGGNHSSSRENSKKSHLKSISNLKILFYIFKFFFIFTSILNLDISLYNIWSKLWPPHKNLSRNHFHSFSFSSFSFSFFFWNWIELKLYFFFFSILDWWFILWNCIFIIYNRFFNFWRSIMVYVKTIPCWIFGKR